MQPFKKSTLKPLLLPSALCLCAFAALCLLTLALTGCSPGSLRFGPTEEQRQVSFRTHQIASNIDALGADPASEQTGQLVAGTAAALAYTGLPSGGIRPASFPDTIKQAARDASARPTPADVKEQVFTAVDEGLGLAGELAILFGVGGLGFGGKKAVDWLRLAREKNTALKEIVSHSEMLQGQARNDFKTAQGKQSPATQRLVTEIKSTRMVAPSQKIKSS